MASCFAVLKISNDEFIEQQKNENRKRKTEQNLSLLNQFPNSKNEKRSILGITSTDLIFYLCEFIQGFNYTKKDYEPKSLRVVIASFERHSKRKNSDL